MTFYLIGTIHGTTNTEELAAYIQKINPDILLVEIDQNEIDQGNDLTKYPPEMQWVVKYGKERQIKVIGFDADFMINHREFSEEEQKKIEELSKPLLQQNWKWFNTLEGRKEMRIIDEKFPATPEDKLREQIMAENIKKYKSGKTCIITGAGHIDYFQQQFPEIHIVLENATN